MVAYIKIEGIGRVTKNMTGYARRIPKSAIRGMSLFSDNLAVALRKEAKAKGHNTTGYLSSKRGTRSVKLNKDTWAIKMPYYTKYLEEGTSPHFIPRTGKTQLWARKHGMSFALMRAIISGKGTDAHPFTARVIRGQIANLKPTVEKQINNAIRKKG